MNYYENLFWWTFNTDPGITSLYSGFLHIWLSVTVIHNCMKSKSRTTPDSNLSLLLGWGDHILWAPSVHTCALKLQNWPGTGTWFRHMSPRTPGFVCPIFHIRHPYFVFLDVSIWSSTPGYLTSLPAEWALDMFLPNEMLMLVATVLWPSCPDTGWPPPDWACVEGAQDSWAAVPLGSWEVQNDPKDPGPHICEAFSGW